MRVSVQTLPGPESGRRWASYGNIGPRNKTGPRLSIEEPRHQRQLREEGAFKELLWFLARSLNT